MNWFYESSGQQQGPIAERDLDALIAEGAITQDTRVWREGMAEWRPLRDVRPPASGSAETPELSADTALPAGFVRCSLTGKAIPEGEALYIRGKPYSAEAKLLVLQAIQQGGRLPTRDLDRNGPAWENRATLGFVRAAWETTKQVLFRPGDTFSGMKRRGGLRTPILYTLLLGCLGFIASLVYEAIANAAATRMGIDLRQEQSARRLIWDITIGRGTSGTMAVVLAALSPLIVLLINFINAGTTHLALLLLSAARQPFEATFRMTCYTSGATASLALIPALGDLLALLWIVVAMCIGTARVHEIGLRRASAAVFLPFITCCGCGALLVAGMGTLMNGPDWWTQIFD